MRQFSLRWLRRFWLAFAVVLVLFTLSISLFRATLPLLNSYKGDISAWLLTQYQLNIQFDSLDATWDSYGPALVIHGATWQLAPNEPFDVSVAQTRIRLDLLTTLHEKQWVFRRIALSGIKLNLYLDNINPLQPSRSGMMDSQHWQAVLLEKIEHFSIRDSQVILHSAQAPTTVLNIDQLSWLNQAGRHQGVGKARVAGGARDSRFNFILNINETDSPYFNDWLGQLYIQADQLNLAPWLAPLVADNSELLQANLNLEGWLDFSFHELLHAQLHIQPSSLTWRSQQQTQRLMLNSGIFKLWPTAAGWQLDANSLNLSTTRVDGNDLKPVNTVPVAEANFDLQLFRHDDFLVGSLTDIDLAPLMPLASLFSPYLAEKDVWWSQLAIDAKASPSQLMYQISTGDYLAHSMIPSVNINGTANTPAVQNLQLQLLASKSGGRVAFALQDSVLDLGHHFQAPLVVGQLSVPLRWQYQPDGLTLSSERSLFSNQDLTWQGQFQLTWSGTDSPFLSLYSEADMKRASEADLYFPIQAMGQNVYDYLQPTIAAGEVTTAKILWHGQLDDYPYADGSGVFQAWVPLTDTEFHFYPGWPPLSKMQIDLLFENDGLSLESADAALMAAHSDKIHGEIAHFSPDANLIIKANILGESQAISDYFNASPLAESVGAALKQLVITGPVQGDLALDIPLNGEPAQVEGKIALKNNRLNVPLSDSSTEKLALNRVSGSFEFDQANLNKGAFTALWNQLPVTVRFSGQELTSGYQAKVNVLADWPIATMQAQWPALHQWGLSGEFGWQANVAFQQSVKSGYQFELDLTSDTLGLGVNLPAPWHKNSLRDWPLSIAVKGNQQSTEVTAELTNKLFLQASFDQRSPEQDRWWLHFGERLASKRPQRNKAVTLAYNQLDLGPWITWWQQLKWAPSEAQGTSAATWQPDFVKLNINQAQLWQQTLEGLSLSARHEQQQWTVQLTSDVAKGKIVNTPTQLNVDFQRINLPDLVWPTSDPDAPAVPWSWQGLKNTQFSCLQCQIGRMNLGQIKGQYSRDQEGISLDQLSLLYGHSDVNITGRWQGGKPDTTQLEVALQSKNIASLVLAQGYDGAMKETPGVAQAQLRWRGSPNMFNTESLIGSASITTNAGYIADVSDKGARLFSLLSLDSIRRKLNLDFRDVFADGLYFDSIKSTATIHNGILSSNDFELNAAAGRLLGKGQLDLNQWQMDYQMSFYPNVTSSLPVLAAFTLTPVTGLYVLLLSKIFEPVVDVISEVNFSLKGDISNPDISEIGRANAVVELPQQIKESYEQRITDSVDQLQQSR